MLTMTFGSVGLAAPREFAFVDIASLMAVNLSETSSGVINTRVWTNSTTKHVENMNRICLVHWTTGWTTEESVFTSRWCYRLFVPASRQGVGQLSRPFGGYEDPFCGR